MGRTSLHLFLCAAAVTAVAAQPASARAARVLVVSDASSDTDIAAVLRADGHEVLAVTGDFASGNATLRGDLSSFALVVWSATGSGYGDAHTDGAVFANLGEFVRAGGRVLVTGYDTVASPTDPLLIAFLGGTGSTDVPPPPGPISMEVTSLTLGVVDIRGVVPLPASPDRDTLTGLMGDTVEIVGTSGGGGSQWTLRRYGAGEIAYVSNGDSAGSTSSWTSTASDGSGVYNAALRNFAWAASGGPGLSRADAQRSPRRAFTLSLTDARSAAVLVGADRAWIPPGVAVPLSVCGPACHPIRETRACEAPECPGPGTLLVATERIADVSDYPRDRDGWNRERVRLMADAELTSLAWAFGVHPEPPPAPPQPLRFVPPTHPGLGFELHLEGGFGALVTGSVGVGTISASLGPRFMPHDIDEPLDVMYGNIHGVDLHATLVPGVSGQRPEDLLVLVGLAPAFAYSFADDRVRIPPAFAFLVPEVGLAVSTSHPLTSYFAWHLETAMLLDQHVGLDVRGDVTLLMDWIGGHDIETMLTLSAGVFFR